MNIIKKIYLPIILIAPLIFEIFYIRLNVPHLSIKSGENALAYIYVSFSVIVPLIVFLVS